MLMISDVSREKRAGTRGRGGPEGEQRLIIELGDTENKRWFLLHIICT